MLNRTGAGVLGLGAALAVVAGCSAPTAPPPHLIVVLVDTLRADRLGVYGYDRPTSPEIDAFAAGSSVFENAYVQTSWTKPSVASLFTGLFPSRHGALRPEHSLRTDVTTLAEQLQGHGYHTAAFVTNPNVLPGFGFGKGFAEFHDVGASERAGSSTRPGARAAEVNEAVFDFLERRPEGPFFLYVHLLDPHSPYGAPGRYRKMFLPPPGPERYELGEEERKPDLYDGEVRYVDHHFGALLDELERRGVDDDALIVFLSDHGEEFQEHGGRGHGHTLFEELLRVPLVVRLPPGRRAPPVVPEPVRVMDLMPTLLELMGFEPPGGTDAVSFSVLLEEDSMARRATYDPLLYAELFSSGHAMRSFARLPWKLIERTEPVEQRGTALFDLESDPGEHANLAEDEADVRRSLESGLDTMVAALGGGVYVELVNAADLEARHVFTGSVTSDGAPLENAGFSNADETRALTVSPDGRRLDFRVELRNRPSPIRQREDVLVDVARLRFDAAPDAGFRVELRLDGQPLPAGEPLLGDGSSALDASADPLTPLDPRLLVASDALRFMAQTAAADRPRARLYSVPAVSLLETELDPEVEERLRALGYIQ